MKTLFTFMSFVPLSTEEFNRDLKDLSGKVFLGFDIFDHSICRSDDLNFIFPIWMSKSHDKLALILTLSVIKLSNFQYLL